jgi:hypothetical protein
MSKRILTKPMWCHRSNYEILFPKGTEFTLTKEKNDQASLEMNIKKLAKWRKKINSHFGYISVKKEFGIGENWFEGYCDTLYLSDKSDKHYFKELIEKSVLYKKEDWVNIKEKGEKR